MQPLTPRASLVLLGATGVARALVARFQERERGRALCLAYHRVAPMERWLTLPPSERRYTVPLSRFEAHLDALGAAGYGFVSLDAVMDHVAGRTDLPPRSVCVTFDDGCESVHRYAMPALVRRRIPAVLFVTVAESAAVFGADTPHGERRMTPDEVRAWASAGLDVGAHGVTHRGLVSLPPEEALDELTRSRAILEGWLGRAVCAVSIPLDLWTASTLELCRRAGFSAVCISSPGAVRAGSDPMRIRRLVVDGRTGTAALLRSLAPWSMVRARAAKALKRIPPRLLGEAAWMPLRRRLLDGDLAACRRWGGTRRWDAPE